MSIVSRIKKRQGERAVMSSEMRTDKHFHFLVRSQYQRDYHERTLIESWHAYDQVSAEKELGLHPKEFELMCRTQTQSVLQKLFQDRLRVLTYQYLFGFLLKKYPKYKENGVHRDRVNEAFQRFPRDIQQQVKNAPMTFPAVLFTQRYPLPHTDKLKIPKGLKNFDDKQEYFHSSSSQVVRVKHLNKRSRHTR